MKRLTVIFVTILFSVLSIAQPDSLRLGSIIPMGPGFLEQETPGDSILVADRMLYGFELKDWPDSVKLIFPEIPQPYMEEMIALPMWQVDTLKIKKQRRSNQRLLDIRAAISLQAFSEGTYNLPPLMVLRPGADGVMDTLVWRSASMEVKTLQVDTASFVPHDIRGQLEYPLTFREIVPWLAGVFFVGVIIVLIVSFFLARKKRAAEASRPKDPPHITALRKLDHYRGDKFWAPEKQKQFYSGVTDALREYIAARYGVGALEMTTAEIFEGLKESDMPEDLKSEMRTLFERADFVKFAKFIATDEENATVLPQAVRFVTTTYQTEIEEEQKNA
ncbi:MAG: hypothetical protein IKR69_03310 [Bacteroidales bacterium]|nr:hypothetical protein [Bacteroidales bacterium]